LKPVVAHGQIFEAWADEEWTVDGADVRVSLICFAGGKEVNARLNGRSVGEIFSDLSANDQKIDITLATGLMENRGHGFIGTQKNGPFEISHALAEEMLNLPVNPNGKHNFSVVKKWINGMDITRRPSNRWIIDFGVDMSVSEAALFERPFQYVQTHVKPARQNLRRKNHREKWWIFGESRPGMRRAVGPLNKFIVTPRVAKHRVFSWSAVNVIPDSRLICISRDDYCFFGILSSISHETWTLVSCSWHGVGNDPAYNAKSCFETFPFPEGLTPNIPAADYAADPRAQKIAAAAERLNTLRENWLNPPDLINRVPEVVAGYPDRILPKDDAAAAILKKRTLTNLYNARPTWLDNAHKILDEAVAEAYGWGDDWRAGLLTDDEIVARLFALNQQRAAQGR
jgi:type II restriction/modification system DNA methylase subunit YeeA